MAQYAVPFLQQQPTALHIHNCVSSDAGFAITWQDFTAVGTNRISLLINCLPCFIISYSNPCASLKFFGPLENISLLVFY